MISSGNSTVILCTKCVDDIKDSDLLLNKSYLQKIKFSHGRIKNLETAIMY